MSHQYNDQLFSWDDFKTLDASAQFALLKGSLEAMNAQACNRIIQQNIINKMHLRSNHKILEIGSGLGKRAKLIAEANNQANVTAVDMSEKFLSIAKEEFAAGNLSYQQADAQALPFPDNSFDIVTAERFLICFKDPRLH
jgi:ubiquinone/menaquinone biosynthesis C-methylase UbiE